MFGFTIAELFWYGTGGVLALAGVGVVIGVLVRSRRPAWRHCPGCLYDMRATQGMQCPECGREARSERAMLRRGIRKRGLIPGAALLALGTIVATHGYARQQPRGWWSLMPTVVLVEMVGLGQREAAIALHDRFSARSSEAHFNLMGPWLLASKEGNPAAAPVRNIVPRWYVDRALDVACRRIVREYEVSAGPFIGLDPQRRSLLREYSPNGWDHDGRIMFRAVHYLFVHADPEAVREALLWIATNGPIDAAWWTLWVVNELAYSSSPEGWVGEPLDPRWYDVVLRVMLALEENAMGREDATEWGAGVDLPKPVPLDDVLLSTVLRVEPADFGRVQAVLSGLRSIAGDEVFDRHIRGGQIMLFLSANGIRAHHGVELMPTSLAMMGVLRDAMLTHPDAYWRVAACYRLVIYGTSDEDAIDKLLALQANDPDPRVRAAAEESLRILRRTLSPSSRMPFMERWTGEPVLEGSFVVPGGQPAERAAEPPRIREGSSVSPPVGIHSAPPSPEPEPGPNDADDRTDQDHDASSVPDPAPAPR